MFDRIVVNFTIKIEPKETVKLEDIKSKLSEEFKDGLIIIYTMKNVYGKRDINGIAQVYKNEDVAKKILQKYVLKKNGIEYAKGKEKK